MHNPCTDTLTRGPATFHGANSERPARPTAALLLPACRSTPVQQARRPPGTGIVNIQHVRYSDCPETQGFSTLPELGKSRLGQVGDFQ